MNKLRWLIGWGLVLFGTPNAWAADGTWNNPAGGSWDNSGNWAGGAIPSGGGDVATFPDLGGPVSIQQPILMWSSMGGLTFDSPHSYTIDPAAGNNQQVGDFMAVALQGSHTFNWRLEPGHGSADLVFDVAEGAELTWAHIIYEYPQGQMGIRKEGPGTAILSSAGGYDWADDRQYRRDVSINEGTLLVNNTEKLGVSKKASVHVNDTGTLGGIGTIGTPGYPGTVIVYSGGTIAPGATVGTFTLNNGLTLEHGSKLAFELGATPGTSDLLRITAGTFTGSTAAGGVTVSIADGGGLVSGATYDLIDFNGATLSGVDLSDFQLAPGPYASSALVINGNKLQVELRTFRFEVETSGSDLLFTWGSTDGTLYNLLSETDLSNGSPGTWPVYDGHENIEATPPENTLTIPLPPEAARYFVIAGFPPPPVTVFSDDFESGQGDWTLGSDGAAGTAWELGSPSGVGPPNANNGANCFGTNIGDDYDTEADVWLRSPEIDLTNAASATLNYFHFADIEEGFDSGKVSVLDASDDSELAILVDLVDGTTTDWEKVTKGMPTEALGKVVKIEFRLTTDELENFAGWYLDDVEVIAQP